MAFLARTSLLRSVLKTVQRTSNLAVPAFGQSKTPLPVGNVTGQRFCSSHEATQSEANYDDDLPDPTMENPFLKEKRCCILCRYGIQADYKNPRLLTQFVSPYTGRMYDKHITGLCETQHRAVRAEIHRSIRFGLLSPWYRDPKYANDPRLFDPTRPTRANPY